MGALPANLSIGRMIRVLALLCLAVLSMGEPEAEAKAVADPRLILIFFMEAITVLDIIMEATMATLPTESTARGLLRLRLKLKLPLKLRPRLKLTLGMDTTVDTTVDTMATPTTESMASKKGTSNAGLMSMKCHHF